MNVNIYQSPISFKNLWMEQNFFSFEFSNIIEGATEKVYKFIIPV
jgi:hypothetical protein